MSAPSKNGLAECPICAKPGTAKFAPFCSRRCADLDLGRWLKGGYAIPGAETETPTDSPPQPPEEE